MIKSTSHIAANWELQETQTKYFNDASELTLCGSKASSGIWCSATLRVLSWLNSNRKEIQKGPQTQVKTMWQKCVESKMVFFKLDKFYLKGLHFIWPFSGPLLRSSLIRVRAEAMTALPSLQGVGGSYRAGPCLPHWPHKKESWSAIWKNMRSWETEEIGVWPDGKNLSLKAGCSGSWL